MKRQSQLQSELKLAYKQGDSKAVARIERLLTPDVVVKIKHPWA